MCKWISALSVGVVMLALASGCSQQTPTSPTASQPDAGQMLFALDAADNIASGVVTITKANLEYTLPITIANHTGSVNFTGIQQGNWFIQVQLFDADGVEIYSGDGQAVVHKNQTTQVTIQVSHNTGDLEIIVEVPNGQHANSGKILFRDGFSGTTMINPDGSGRVHLIDGAYNYGTTNYRGGSIILYGGDHPNGPHQGIWQCNMDGTGAHRLDLPSLYYPRWSWSGHKFSCHAPGNIIHVYDPDGTNGVTLTTGNNAVWTPDDRIVYGDNDMVRVMNSDGTNQQTILSGLPAPYVCDVAADLRILYAVSTNSGQIWVVNLDGTGNTMLAPGPNDYACGFNEDGTQITYESRVSGGKEIWIMNADGSGKIQLTFDGGQNENPHFLY